MSGGVISRELAEEIYDLTGINFFDSCWQGHDELEQAVVDWAKRDFKAGSITAAHEIPAKLETLMREAGDEILADFINDLDPDLRREALTMVSEYLQEAVDDSGADRLISRLDEIIAELS